MTKNLVICDGTRNKIWLLRIARELWSDQALRNAGVVQAQERATKAQASGACHDVLKCTTDAIRAAEVPPIGWARDSVRGIPEG